MKNNLLLVIAVFALVVSFAQAQQNSALPRLAVVRFNINIDNDKTKADAITVRNLVESQMVATRRYQIITRDEIDKLLENQQIQTRDISSNENIQKLQLQNVSYIVTGSLDAIGNDYALTVHMLDVATGQFSHSDNGFIRSGSWELYTGVNELATKFVAGMFSAQTQDAGQSEATLNNAQTYFNRGEEYRNKGEYDLAIVDYTQAIRLNPNYAIAYNNRGYAYYNKGDYDRAIADHTEAIRIDPNYALAYNNRGWAYGEKNDYDRAIADYTQAIRLNPNYALAYHNRGYAYDDKGDYDRAIADYTEAIRIDPNYALAYHNRGYAYRNKGDYDRAIADYTEAIRLDLNAAVAYNNRGYAYNKKGDRTRARADWSKALELDPSNTTARNNLETL